MARELQRPVAGDTEMMVRSDGNNTIGRTAGTLAVLGVSSALFGALVFAPRLEGHSAPAPSISLPSVANEPAPAPAARVTEPSLAAPAPKPVKSETASSVAVELPRPAEKPAPVEVKQASAVESRVKAAEPVRVKPKSRKLHVAAPVKVAKSAPAPVAAESGSFVHIRVGSVQSHDDAAKLRDEIAKSTGQEATLQPTGDGYQVQVGAYKHRGNAQKVAETLRAHNYQPDLSEDTESK